MDVKSDHAALRNSLLAAMTRVLDSGQYILGPEVAQFEAELARFIGVPYCLGLSSGTHALQIALQALGVGPGDEVILPAMTFIATATAVSAVGAKPVLADIDPRTATLDPREVLRHITPRTRVVLPVHLYGHPADMDRLLELAGRHGCRVVEDCAQAHGALWRGRPVGSLGDIGCFSFYPTKNLGAVGDAGAIVTRDQALWETCHLIRNVGRKPGDKYTHTRITDHARLDEIQAAILRVKLKRLEDWVEARRQIAAQYRRTLSGLPIELPPDGSEGTRHAYHIFVIRAPQRDDLARRLAEAKVETGVYYPLPVHLQPAYSGLGHRAGDFPIAEQISQQTLALPVYPGLPASDIDRISWEIRKFYKG